MLGVIGFQHAKQGFLAAGAVVGGTGGAGEGTVNLRGKAGATLAKAVAGAGLDQRFQHLAVDRPEIDAVAEIGQGTESAGIFAGSEHGFHGGFAHAFDGGEAVTDHGAVSRGGEFHLRFVDIRRQDVDAHRFGFVDQDGELAGVAHVVGTQGGKKFHRIMRLEIGRLIGHHGIGGGV